MDVSLSELRELVVDREAWRAAIHGIEKSQTRLSDWTELNWTDASRGSLQHEKNMPWATEESQENKHIEDARATEIIQAAPVGLIWSQPAPTDQQIHNLEYKFIFIGNRILEWCAM